VGMARRVYAAIATANTRISSLVIYALTKENPIIAYNQIKTG
jgi:hypothetical protein